VPPIGERLARLRPRRFRNRSRLVETGERCCSGEIEPGERLTAERLTNDRERDPLRRVVSGEIAGDIFVRFHTFL
jgi:hypothetical protein